LLTELIELGADSYRIENIGFLGDGKRRKRRDYEDNAEKRKLQDVTAVTQQARCHL
jgi:hypothetical protein